MTSVHQAQEFFIGDDWEIEGTMLDKAGVAIPLAGVTIQWALLNEARETVLDHTDATITLISGGTTGKCRIKVAAAKTAALSPGKYSDAARIVYGGITSTMWVGPIIANASPFNTPPAP